MRIRHQFLPCFVVFVLFGGLVIGISAAQDKIETPSQKTKAAVDKFNKAPATIGKSLDALMEAAKGKLKQAVGGTTPSQGKPNRDDLSLPPKAPEQSATAPFSPAGKRDPFRPYDLKTSTTSRPRENLSPLERIELSQLRLVGIVWDVKEPRAMIEDTGGLGYIVTIGTPIGSNEGKVKAIHRNEVVVEESYEDVSGAKKKREVSMKLAVD